MTHSLFSEKMKMADLILANYRLLYVLPCFDIGLGLGESTVKQVCEKKNISIPLFLLVCNVFTFDDYRPDNKTLKQIPVGELIQYIRKSHYDYLHNRLPKITEQVLELANLCSVQHREILAKFCEKYKNEVVAHFEYEEQTVFPYITSLLNKNVATGYKIGDYEGNHSNIEAALNDLKNIIIKYLPPECTSEKCRDVLFDLFLFESDLTKHTLLEDKILVSLVEKIEKSGKDE